MRLDYKNPFESSPPPSWYARHRRARGPVTRRFSGDRMPGAARQPGTWRRSCANRLFRAKSRSCWCAAALAERHAGEVPGPWTRYQAARVDSRPPMLLGNAFDEPAIAVDTHVLRVTNRLGIARADDPLVVERQLMAIIPRERWTRTTDLVIFHGRKICIARRPLCGECPVFALCRWPYRQAYAMARPPAAAAAARRGPRKRGGEAMSRRIVVAAPRR